MTQKLYELYEARNGITTGQNDLFIRYWYEVEQKNNKWFKCNKGGSFRRWYGNQDYVIDWENDGFRLKNFRDDKGKQRSTLRSMSEDDRKEFRRAIGLYASGIGAGAYVYLRRIFESLLEQAKGKAGDAIDIKAFNNAHVGEKITMLSSYLPSALTSNTVLYGILSKGIHELTEEQCLTYFPVLKDCLYMILDQWEEMRKKEEKEKSIKAALSKIATNIN